MTITSELIGKLGGADVEVVPVDVETPYGTGGAVVMHTVEVPEGETWLVAAHGNLRSQTTGSYSAQIGIGTTTLPPNAPNGITGMAHVGTGTIDVRLIRNRSSGSDSFTGHVYAVQL